MKFSQEERANQSIMTNASCHCHFVGAM